jgi:hypothetical protein
VAAIIAALAGPISGEVAALIGGSGVGSILARGALAGVGAIAAADLLKAIQSDISPSSAPSAKATALRVPQYAIVDMHSNKVVRFLSTRKVYSILTHPSRRGGRGRRTTRIINVGRGEEVTVK